MPVEIIYTINLAAFVRRTANSSTIKAFIKDQGCQLNRSGRSRNWQLKANVSQLQAIVIFIEQQNEASWFWLAKLFKKDHLHLKHEDLITFANGLTTLTISALMTQTDCTLVQARRVLDELEVMD